MYTQVYGTFLKMVGKTWEPPSYKLIQKFPYIPTEQDADRLIAASGKKLAAALQTAKETALRVGEITSLKWINLDSEKSLIVCNDPEKNSLPRIFKISSKLNAMLNKLPRRNEYIFACPIAGRLIHLLTMERKTILRKLQDTALANIHFHTLRHWKATVLSHETKNPMLVKEFLGHKSLLTTQRYIHIEQALFKDLDDKFTVMAVKTPEESNPCLRLALNTYAKKTTWYS
jgi:integrase